MPNRFNPRLLHLSPMAAGPVAIPIHVTGLSLDLVLHLRELVDHLHAGYVAEPLVDDQEDRDGLPAGEALIVANQRQYEALVARLSTSPHKLAQDLAQEIQDLLKLGLSTPPPLTIRDHVFDWHERTFVMGIINTTPDSFSGDGLLDAQPDHHVIDRALDQAHKFAGAGADLLDIGGESTRPGAGTISASEEISRVVPVIKALRQATGLPISVDTWKAEVAEPALEAGADLVNDVWGLRQPRGGWNEPMARLVAERGVPVVLMHNRRARAAIGDLGGHYDQVPYVHLLGDVIRELRESIAFAEHQGIRRENIIVDPGIGFGKTPSQNIMLLRHLSELRSLGLPILLGTSRKSFIGLALNLPVAQRIEGTGATVALGIQSGADIVRVHDVAPMVRVARMADAVLRPGAWERMLSH